jgi:hypothetical protein
MLLGLAWVGCGEDPTPPPASLPPDPVTLHVGVGATADTLRWTSSSASDFAAYVVVRRGNPEAVRVLARSRGR